MARVLLVDLNNFAHYPSIAVGLLVAALRGREHSVRVFSPLAHGVLSLPRERVETWRDGLERRISFSTRRWLHPPRRALGALRSRWRGDKELRALPALAQALAEGCDLLLISAYTDSLELVREMCAAGQGAGVPVVIGGPIFSQAAVSRAWARIPGVRAVVGGEFERRVGDFCEDVLAGANLDDRPGVFHSNGNGSALARPERDLDGLPLPDYTDFPWQAYERRVIPILMGRGCGWGRCRFCGDIVTANGRSFRTRSVRNVLEEMLVQSERHGTRDFVFLDLKLNSRPELWRELLRGIARELPDARWIGSVHVQDGADCGLEQRDLAAARAAGMLRVTFGMESGSQRVLDGMEKGTSVARNRRFVREAAAAGLSVRTTLIQGYPGEAARDLDATAQLVEELTGDLERVRVNRLNVLEGTRLAGDLDGDSGDDTGGDVHGIEWEHEWARCSYRHRLERDRDYRGAMRRLLRAVHAINRREIREAAQAFHGLM